MKNKFLPALAVLVGTAIGAGYLGIPYVVSKSGFIPGLACLILVGIFMITIYLYLGEISLRTKGTHQLTGYAQRYLGKSGKMLMFLSMIFGIFSALSAYLLAQGESLSYVFFGVESFGLLCSIGFWILMAGLTYIGLSALKKIEKFVVFFVFLVLILIVVVFSGKINLDNLTYINPKNFFVPFGLIFFSFLAFSAMPEVERILHGQERLMKKVVFFGMLIPFTVYLLFMIVLLGNFGINVPEIATLALGRFFSVLGILTMFTAYFASTIAIRDMFRFDFNLGRIKGWLLAVFVPLILFLLIYFYKLASFVQILSVSGIVSGGLAGILILLMNRKAKTMGNRKPEYSIKINWWIIGILSFIFIAAVVAEFVL